MTELILGAGGMLARGLARERPGARALGIGDLDITDAAALARAVVPGVSVVWNAAADTRVDLAETDPSHLAVNDVAVGVLAGLCRDVGALLVHVSTDYVFDGCAGRAWREDDPVAPINAYGRGKLGGERRALASGAEVLIVRTSWVFAPGGVNFVDTMLGLAASGNTELKAVDDQRGRPTFAPDLARALVKLVSAGARGIVHFANAGETTWFGLAKEALARGGYPNVKLVPCATAEFPRPAARPANSILDTSLYEKLTGQAPRHFTAALDEHLRLLAEAARE
ncbi:MAG TPA: dTDP-4-dehydrorhamnose reductase [Thermoanaerobaculia bacterium]|nr:dTDP-4-dehydrorhamnose reductase [Thermoanaerobaculia bacterium]